MHSGIVDLYLPKSRGRMDTSHGHHFAVCTVKGDQVIDVHVRHTVAIGKQKNITGDVRRDTPEPCTCFCIETSSGNRHTPFFFSRDVHRHIPVFFSKVDSEIAMMHGVIEKIVFDLFSLVSSGEDKVRKTKRIINLHNMPQYWTFSDTHQRFR